MCAHSQATLKSEAKSISSSFSHFSLFYLFSYFNVNFMRDLPKRKNHKDARYVGLVEEW
jgi:hypothetical protein